MEDGGVIDSRQHKIGQMGDFLPPLASSAKAHKSKSFKSTFFTVAFS